MEQQMQKVSAKLVRKMMNEAIEFGKSGVQKVIPDGIPYMRTLVSNYSKANEQEFSVCAEGCEVSIKLKSENDSFSIFRDARIIKALKIMEGCAKDPNFHVHKDDFDETREVLKEYLAKVKECSKRTMKELSELL